MFQTPADWMYDEVMKTPTEVATAMLAAVAATDLRPLLPQLDLPALGTADKATPASSSARPFVMWAAGAIIALGLAVLYTRRPRAATPA